MRDTPRRPDLSLDDYYEGVRSFDLKVFPRALTLMESQHPRHQVLAEQLLTRLLPHAGTAVRVGITGAPGVGKSTFIDVVGRHLVKAGHRLAVLAVDPSSDLTGGSVLGDKTRMARLAAEENAFIRPSPSAGTLGGVARKTRECLLVCEAAGFDVVLVETVGVGQSESMVADMTDCFLALLAPGAGDDLQGMKRGLLELVDVIAVNKADGPTRQVAETTAHQYDTALGSLLSRTEERPVVMTCSALFDLQVDAVWQALAGRHAELKDQGHLEQRRRQQSVRWLWAIIEDRLREAVREHPGVQSVRVRWEQDVLDGTVTAEAAARAILEAFASRRDDPS